MSFLFDAFISYRRSDGKKFAHRLRRMLIDYKLPSSLVNESTPRGIAIYLDTIYEQANEDFFEKTILPALRASRNLIVVQTPDALKPQKNGTANWLVREVEFFRTLPQGRNVSVALAKGYSAELPARLHIDFPNIEIVDLRRLGLLNSQEVRDRVLTFIAPLYDLPPERMPELRQEERRRKQRRRQILASSLILVSLAAAGLLGWLTYQYRWLPVATRNHWKEGYHGEVKIEPLEAGQSVLTGTFPDGPYAHLWDTATARKLLTIKGHSFTLLPKRRHLLVTSPKRRIYALDLVAGKTYITPLTQEKLGPLESAPWYLDYGSSGMILLQIGKVDELSLRNRLPSIVVWSLNSGKVGRVDGFLSGGDWQFEVSNDGKRLIANQFEPRNFQPKLWNVETGAPIASLHTAANNTETDFKINNHLALIVTRALLDSNGTKQQFALWKLSNGAPAGAAVTNDMGDSPVSVIVKMRLSNRGAWILRGGGQEGFEAIEIIDGKTLRPLAGLSGKAQGWWVDEDFFLLDEEGHASLWDVGAEHRIGVQDIDLKTITSVAVSSDKTRAALVREAGRAELWDLRHGKKLCELPLSTTSCYPTIDRWEIFCCDSHER